MNIIWLILIVISTIIAIINGKVDELTKSIFEAGKTSIELSLYLLGIVSIWLGLTKILEDAGLIAHLSSIFRPLISKLFPNIPNNHPSLTSITLNFIANLFGLGNAATPLGIKAMQDLQTLNNQPDTITWEMMVFIVINTASIQIIPFSVIGILSTYGSTNATAILIPTIVSTILSAILALYILFLFKKFSK